MHVTQPMICRHARDSTSDSFFLLFCGEVPIRTRQLHPEGGASYPEGGASYRVVAAALERDALHVVGGGLVNSLPRDDAASVCVCVCDV